MTPKLNIDRFVEELDKELDLHEIIPYDDESLENYLLRVDKEEKALGANKDRRDRSG